MYYEGVVDELSSKGVLVIPNAILCSEIFKENQTNFSANRNELLQFKIQLCFRNIDEDIRKYYNNLYLKIDINNVVFLDNIDLKRIIRKHNMSYTYTKFKIEKTSRTALFFPPLIKQNNIIWQFGKENNDLLLSLSKSGLYICSCKIVEKCIVQEDLNFLHFRKVLNEQTNQSFKISYFFIKII